MDGTLGSAAISTRLQRIAKLAMEKPAAVPTTLSHPMDLHLLVEAYRHTRKDGALGVDGQRCRTARASLSRALGRDREWCRRNRHLPVPEQQRALGRKLMGHDAYYGITANGSIEAFPSRGIPDVAEVARSSFEPCADELGSIQSVVGAIPASHPASRPFHLPAGEVPLLVCDVWEHACYLDQRNDRVKFLQTFLAELANWDRVEECPLPSRK